MKKKLNEADIVNELKGGSLFFSRNPDEAEAPPAAPAQGDQPEDTFTRNPENTKTRKHETMFPRLVEGTETRAAFDINVQPTAKYTSLFATEELEALDDLKTALRRQYGIKATKIDLIRYAIHHLIEDYRSQGDQSIVLERLKKKLPR